MRRLNEISTMGCSYKARRFLVEGHDSARDRTHEG